MEQDNIDLQLKKQSQVGIKPILNQGMAIAENGQMMVIWIYQINSEGYEIGNKKSIQPRYTRNFGFV